MAGAPTGSALVVVPASSWSLPGMARTIFRLRWQRQNAQDGKFGYPPAALGFRRGLQTHAGASGDSTKGGTPRQLDPRLLQLIYQEEATGALGIPDELRMRMMCQTEELEGEKRQRALRAQDGLDRVIRAQACMALLVDPPGSAGRCNRVRGGAIFGGSGGVGGGNGDGDGNDAAAEEADSGNALYAEFAAGLREVVAEMAAEESSMGTADRAPAAGGSGGGTSSGRIGSGPAAADPLLAPSSGSACRGAVAGATPRGGGGSGGSGATAEGTAAAHRPLLLPWARRRYGILLCRRASQLLRRLAFLLPELRADLEALADRGPGAAAAVWGFHDDGAAAAIGGSTAFGISFAAGDSGGGGGSCDGGNGSEEDGLGPLELALVAMAEEAEVPAAVRVRMLRAATTLRGEQQQDVFFECMERLDDVARALAL
ncbi:unnamed protein product, partial [Phaeothamnion confervicola]